MRVAYLSRCFKPVSEVSSSHAGRIFNEQNATVEILRFVMRDQIHRSSRNPQEPARRTIGSRSRSAVYTNEVAPYSRILRSTARWVVLTLARYFPFARVLPMAGALLSNSAVKPLFSRAYNLNLIPCSSLEASNDRRFIRKIALTFHKTPMCSLRFKLGVLDDAMKEKYDVQ